MSGRVDVERIALGPADWQTMCAECRHPRATHGFSGAYCTWWDQAYGDCACQGFRAGPDGALPAFPFARPRLGEAACVLLPTGQLAAVRPMVGVTMLSVDYPPAHPIARHVKGRVYWDSWKYPSVPAATFALALWRRAVLMGMDWPEPMGWSEHPASGRRQRFT